MIVDLIFWPLMIILTISFCIVIRDSIRREGKMGINLEKIKCPRCGEKKSNFKFAKSFPKILWGSWVCGKCGCEMDQWGKEIERKNK